jgi:uncharacterized heparinase superfamily protein
MTVLIQISWYCTRLVAMSKKELLHRLIETGKKAADRRFNAGWAQFPTGGITPIQAIAKQMQAADSALISLLRREAVDIVAGRFRLLGATWPKDRTILSPDFWHIDPDLNTVIPGKNKYCFDNSRLRGTGSVEIKRVWEINRLQFLVPLAVDAMIRNDAESRDLISAIVFSWMKGNPPYRGVNWTSGIELGLRVLSVAMAFSIVGTEHLDVAAQHRLHQFFIAHILGIARYPSLHSSANNHRVAELAGLIVATSFAPDNVAAGAERQQCLEMLLDEFNRQILPDGVGAEQAPNYSAFMIELTLLALFVAGRPAHSIPSEACRRLAAWAEHARWMMDASGNIPAIGDSDDCRAIALTQAPERRYVASIVAAIAGYLSLPEIAPPSRDIHLRDLLFASPRTGAPALTGMKTWTEGGYTILRGANENPFVLTVDHGPLGYLSIAAHGHADALSFWLTLGDQPIIVDAGTYLYHSAPLWRDRFRGSLLHNTLAIRGQSSSKPAGPFNWTTKASARLVSANSDPHPRIVAEHDGYLVRFGVRHRRTIEILEGRTVTIVDELVGGSREKPATVAFLIDPACHAVSDAQAKSVIVSLPRGETLRFISHGPLTPRIVRGDAASGLGWIAPTFGARIPTDQILFEGRFQSSSTITVHLP